MIKFALAFLLGVIILTMFDSLPQWQWIFGLIPAVLVSIKFPRSALLMTLVLGFLWALGHAYLKLYPSLDKSLEGIDLNVVGKIVSIPSIQKRGVRFEFLIFKANQADNNERVITPKKVRLNWFDETPNLKLGEQWQLRVRLKRPWGFANLGSFDYEKWLFEHEIRATGYVRDGEKAKRLQKTNISHPAHFLRAWLNEKLKLVSPGLNSSIIKALALGERGAMSPEHWKVLVGTGTNHLLAISGLHISLVSGLVYLLALKLCKLSESLCLRIAAQRVAALAGMAASIMYAMLAGFSIPTQRAMIMAAIVFMAVYFSKSLRPWNILSIALISVLVWDPFSVLAPGFWLSFLAVALIIFTVTNQRKNRSWLLRLAHIQWILALGLLPLTLVFFQQASLVSPVANFFAVPWVSFVVVPLVLIGSSLLVISDILSSWVLQAASYSIDIFWLVLNYLYKLPYAQWSHSAPTWTLFPAAFGIVLLLSPKGWPSKIISLVLLSPLIFAQSISPLQDDEFRLTILDVGQGLSVVLESKQHVLVYDTGPIYSRSFNAGEAIIIPYLQERGVEKIDMLVISHTDKDHAGGLEGVLSNIQVDRLVASTPDELDYERSSSCRRGVTWQWDKINFQFLHPTEDMHRLSKNNQSCVLHVQHPAGSVLITGDIEHPIEQILVENQAHLLDTDVLIVPHHGSGSSSTTAFIRATSPQYAILATGYRNPYGLPKPEVVSRYEEFGATLINTASQGMITFTFSNQQGLQLHPGYRNVRKRFWHSSF